MRALVTGGAGFIGSHTIDRLLDRGYEVRVVDSLEEPVHRDNKPPSYLKDEVEFVKGDVRSPEVMEKALRGCDVVFHFAAFQDYLPVFSRFFTVNVASTALIYEIIVREKLPVEKVIVASSQAAMGEGLYEDAHGRRVVPDIRPEDQLARGEWEVRAPEGYRAPLRHVPSDESVSNPQNQYGLSKISEESIAVQIGKRYGIPSVALRYSIVQGPRQSFYNAYSGACRIFCLNFHQQLSPPIYEDGEQVRDFVNIQDVVDANLLVLDDPRADYQVFNVGGGKAITVNEFARIVAEVFDIRDYEPESSGKYRFGDTRHIVSDIGKLEGLGWHPRRSVRESVEAYREWMGEAASVREILRYCDEQMEKLDVVRSVGR